MKRMIRAVLFRMRSLNDLWRSSIASMSLRVSGLLAGYLFIHLALRYTSLSMYGSFVLSLALIQLGALGARLGLDLAVVKHVAVSGVAAHATPAIRDYYRQGLWIITVAGLGITTLVYFGSSWLAQLVFHQPGLTTPFRIAAWGILPTALTHYHAGALRGLKQVALYAGLLNGALVAAVTLLLFSHYTWMPAYPLEATYVAGAILMCAVSFYAWHRQRLPLQPAGSYPSATTKGLLRESLPMLSASALTIVQGWTDTLFLGILSSQENVGIFQVLLKLAAILNIVLFAVNSGAAPQFAQLHQGAQHRQLRLYVQRSTRLIVWASLPVLAVLALAYTPLIRWLGNDFDATPYYIAFLLLCAGQAVNAFCGSGGQLLTMTGHQNINRNIIFLSFLISTVLYVILIPRWGVYGAAIANMSGLISRNLLYVYYTYQRLQVNPMYNPWRDVSRMLRGRKTV